MNKSPEILEAVKKVILQTVSDLPGISGGRLYINAIIDLNKSGTPMMSMNEFKKVMDDMLKEGLLIEVVYTLPDDSSGVKQLPSSIYFPSGTEMKVNSHTEVLSG